MRIACWSGPRNISTALMRSWSSRNDTFVSDEPFYAPYLHKNNIRHPMIEEIINKYETNYQQVIKNITSEIPKSKNIWYQKHMAHHIEDINHLDWIEDFHNTLLIRHPALVINSFSKKFEIKSIEQLGYPQQYQIYKYLKEKNKKISIIDSSLFLISPKEYLKEWCRNLNINFQNEMMEWKKGPHENDGIWGSHWYKNVLNSTGFLSGEQHIPLLPKKYYKIYDEGMVFYKEMINFMEQG